MKSVAIDSNQVKKEPPARDPAVEARLQMEAMTGEIVKLERTLLNTKSALPDGGRRLESLIAQKRRELDAFERFHGISKQGPAQSCDFV